MRTQKTDNATKLWLSARETYDWAHRGGASWPGSFLAGRRLFAEFAANGDLVDLAIDGGRGDQDCPCGEFDAIVEDHIGEAHPAIV